jgi:hypothetical protein
MTALESVLTTRNATLGDMVALLRRQHDAKLDVVVPAGDLRMSGGDLHIEGIGEPTITLDGVTPARGLFRPTLTCDGGIADKLGIPSQYLRRMREVQVALLEMSAIAADATCAESKPELDSGDGRVGSVPALPANVQQVRYLLKHERPAVAGRAFVAART